MTPQTYPSKRIDSPPDRSRQAKFNVTFCLLLLISLLQGDLFAQVVNITQAGIIESGYGKEPNLTGASVVDVQGNYAYVVGTGNVLEILDITLPGLPVHKGSITNGEGGAIINRVQSLIVRGNFAYLSSNAGSALEIIDISNAAKPVHKGSIVDGKGAAPYLDGAWGMSIVGDYAYIASINSHALEIIDISNPSSPKHKGNLRSGDLTGNNTAAPFLYGAVAVEVVGKYAYVTSIGEAGGALEIVDVSNPASPKHVGSLLNGGAAAPFIFTPYGIDVKGNYAYITDYGNNAFEIVDISNPALPVHKGALQNGLNGQAPFLRRPWAVKVEGNYAYVTNFTYYASPPSPGVTLFTAFEIIDISDPANPVHASGLQHAMGEQQTDYYQSRSVVIVGAKAFTTTRSDALNIIDISNPLTPQLFSAARSGSGGALLNGANSVAIANNHAFVTSYNESSLEIIDVSNPALPLHKASFNRKTNIDAFISNPTDVTVYGDYAYVLNHMGVLEILNVRNPSNPFHEKYVPLVIDNSPDPPTMFYPTSMANRNGMIFATARKRYFTMDDDTDWHGEGALITVEPRISDPGNLGPIVNVVRSGEAGGAFLKHPSDLCFTEIEKVGLPPEWRVLVTNDSTHTLEVFGIDYVNNVYGPQFLGKISDGEGGAMLKLPVSVFAIGEYAYVVSQESKALEIIDFSDPANLTHVSSIVDGQGGAMLEGANDVYVAGKYAYVTCDGSSSENSAANGHIEVIDISDPENPVYYGRLAHGTNGALLDAPNSIVVSGNYAFATNSNLRSYNVGLYENLNIAYLYGPSLDSFSPSTGAVGTPVTISGKNFNTFLTATVNGTPAEITSLSENLLTFTVPPGAANGKIVLSYQGQNFVGGNNYVVTPTAAAATAPLQDSFVASWSDVGSSAYFLDVSTDNFSTFVTDNNNRSVGNATSLTVTGLASGTAYQYRVRSSDGGIISSNSNTIATLTIPATPTMSAATDITQTSFKINWGAVSGASGYRLDVATDETFSQFLTGLENLSVSSTTQTINVSSSGTTYYYRVRSVNASGTSPSSVVAAATTIPTAPTASLANAITSTGFTANWSLVTGATEYYVDVSTDNFITLLADHANQLAGNETTFSFTGLASGTTYYYRVRAANASGTSGHSNAITVFTLTPVPAAQPTSLVFSNSSGSSTTVSYTAADGNPNGYLVLRASGSQPSEPPVTGTVYANGSILGNANVAYAGPSLSFFDGGLPTATKYYYKVYSYNGNGAGTTYLTADPLQGDITLDVSPPSISLPAISNPTTITSGNTPTFNAIIIDNVSVADAKIFYRGISQKSFKSAPLSPSGVAGNYAVQIQTSWYDSLGIEYYFWAIDENDNESAKPTSHHIAQLVTSFNIPSLPSGTNESSYGIVSFPYKLTTDNKVTTVYPGVPWNDDTKAGMWLWDPSSQDGSGAYAQYGKPNSFETVDPGKGYWVIVSTPASPQLSNVVAPKYNQANLFSMTLKPKWNLIGNPYPVPIAWEDVIAYNQSANPNAEFSALTVYDGSGYKVGNQLKAFQGGFVKNLGASDITIQIPFPGQLNSGRKEVISSDISRESWHVLLHIDQNNLTNQLGGFGMHPQAIPGQDRFDHFNPPSFLDMPSVSFTNPQFASVPFSKDMVKSEADHIWQFSPAGKQGEPAQLRWSPEVVSGSSRQLFLLDEEHLHVVDMLRVQHYDFMLTKNSTFRIFYGHNVEDKITTQRIVVGAPYPNPMLPSVIQKVNVALPDGEEAYHVSLQLYNGRGEVMDATTRTLNPGIHQLEFRTGTESVPSGIYVYKIVVTSGPSSSVYTGKIVKP